MKLRLTLLFAVIALLGFTAASKHKFKVTNAVELCLPSTFVYHEEDSIEVKNSLKYWIPNAMQMAMRLEGIFIFLKERIM